MTHLTPQNIDSSMHSEKIPLLPPEELIPFVEHYFRRREAYLKQLKEHASFLYVLEPDVLIRRADQFKKAFRRELPDSGFYFAVKSNNHPEVARTLLKSGFGLDVSSGLELQTAIDINAKEIIFSGPGKTPEELELAVHNSNRVTVLMDSFGELHRLEKAAAILNTKVRTGVRLTTNPDGLWRKFGIPPDQLAEFWQIVRTCPHVSLNGIQFHTSWNLTATSQTDTIGFLGELLSRMPDNFNENLSFIDVGGGYWPQQGEWLLPPAGPQEMFQKTGKRLAEVSKRHFRCPAEPIEAFAQKIGQAIKHHIFPWTSCRIYFEPGRWICNDSMHLLMTVVDQKGKDLVITDAGTNAVGWERFETDYFPVLNLTRPALTEKPCYILGSLCTPHDVWGFSYFGRDIRVGDVLMIPTQGAYTYSLRQNFIKPVPEVVIM
jgi:diaminopimelate decarboxylase